MVLCEKINGAGEGLGGTLRVQLDAGHKGIFAQAREKAAQMRSILRADGVDLHTEAAAVLHMADFSFGANLAFLNEEVKQDKFSFFFSRAAFEKQAGGAQILDPGDVAIRGGFPVNPNVFDSGNTRGTPTGWAG